jgi:hypothetical protein
MALAVEHDETADPVDVGGLGADGIVANADLGADAVEEARGVG